MSLNTNGLDSCADCDKDMAIIKPDRSVDAPDGLLFVQCLTPDCGNAGPSMRDTQELMDDWNKRQQQQRDLKKRREQKHTSSPSDLGEAIERGLTKGAEKQLEYYKRLRKLETNQGGK